MTIGYRVRVVAAGTSDLAAIRSVDWVAPFLGVLATGVGAVVLGVVGYQALGQEHDLGGAFSAARGVMVGPALLVMVVALLLCERRWPAVRRPLFARAHVVDAGYLALFALLLVPALVLVQTGLAIELEHHAHFLLLGHLPVVPRIMVSAMILVLVDAMNWVAHVANHRVRAFWRLHALHHSQEDMSVLTTFRTHPLMHAPYLLALFPALILGASGAVPSAAVILYGCLVTLPHANLRWTFGSLGRIVVSPAYHRFHHARDIGTNGAVNFGFVLVIWDRLAGSAVFPEPMGSADEPIPTGIKDRTVPVEQRYRRGGLVGTMVAQLAQPFAPQARTDGAS